MKIRLRNFAILLLASTLVISVFAVTYILDLSSPKTATWGNGTIHLPVTLTLNSTSLTDQDFLNLTATTSLNGDGLTCNFYDSGTKIGSAMIVNGFANITIPFSLNNTYGLHTYTAGP